MSNPVLGLLIYFLYYPGTTWDESRYLDGYHWHEVPIYHPDVDGETKYGSSLGVPRHSLVGGFYNGALVSGSRTMYCNILLSAISSMAATRGCKHSNYYPGATWDGEHTWLSSYHWQEIPVYHSGVDGETKYGLSTGLSRHPFVGDAWADGSRCGSRSVSCCYFSTNNAGSITTRGCKKREYPGAKFHTGDNTGWLGDQYMYELDYSIADWFNMSNSIVDTTVYGSSYGYLRRNIVGNHFHNSPYTVGTRSVAGCSTGLMAANDSSARGCKHSNILSWDDLEWRKLLDGWLSISRTSCI